MASESQPFTVDFCQEDDHPGWGSTRRSTYAFVELAIILSSVMLAQLLRGFGHGYAYMIALAFCSLALKMMPHALAWYALGNTETLAVADQAYRPLQIASYSSVLLIILLQWLASVGAGVVVQSSGTCLWFEHLIVKYFAGKAKRAALPVTCAVIGVFSSLACGTDAVNLLYLAPIINASKILGLRPSKPISALVVAGVLGAACSPVNPAVQYYYNRHAVRNITGDKITDGFSPLMPFGHLAVCVIPAAVIGAVCAGAVATFIGRDLETSKTYQRRYTAGLVSHPGSDDLAYWQRLARARGEEIVTESTTVHTVHRDVHNEHLTKLEREFSMQSRLEDGDFVYTNARFRDGSYVDINDRQGATGALHSGVTHANSNRKSVTINVADKVGGSMPGADGKPPVFRQRSLRTTRRSHAALALMFLTGCAVLVLGVLKATPEKAENDELDKATIIPNSWPLPTAYLYPVLFLAISGVVMIINRLRSWYVTHASIVRFAVPGIMGMLCFCALGGSYVWEWRNSFNCIMISKHTDKPGLWVVWIALLAILSGHEAIAQHRVVDYVSLLDSVATRVRWLTAGLPIGALSTLLPTNANMIMANELDDTGSTRLGDFMFDHVFFVPGLVGGLVAAGIAYGIAVGVFPL